MEKIKDVQKMWDKIPNNSLKKLSEDERGLVYRVKIENFGFNIIYTKKGGIRGADIHPNKQYDLILKGKFEIQLKGKNNLVKFKKTENDVVIIPPRVPHLFKCLEDSIMIEWWDGPFKQEFYEPFKTYIGKKFPNKNKSNLNI